MDNNVELNQLSQYKDKKCVYCGRKYPETILNIEGYIHHNCKIRCVNVKSCNKYKKKKKNVKSLIFSLCVCILLHCASSRPPVIETAIEYFTLQSCSLYTYSSDTSIIFHNQYYECNFYILVNDTLRLIHISWYKPFPCDSSFIDHFHFVDSTEFCESDTVSYVHTFSDTCKLSLSGWYISDYEVWLDSILDHSIEFRWYRRVNITLPMDETYLIRHWHLKSDTLYE